MLSVSLASGIGSLRPVCEAWKAGTLTQSMLTVCDSYYKYSSVPVAPCFSLSSSPRSNLSSLWRVTSVSALSGTLQPFSGFAVLPSSARPSILLPRGSSRTPSSKKRPLVRLRPRGRCLILGDWRSSWFAERQVCSVHSSLLCNNNFSPCLRIIDRLVERFRWNRIRTGW